MSGAGGAAAHRGRHGSFRFRPSGLLFSLWMLVLMRASNLRAQATALPLERGAATTSSEKTVTRLAFGSCNKQHLPQPMWKSVEELSPDVWLWMGDAVYVDKFSDGGVEKMKEAFARQLQNEDYQRFLTKVPRVEGVWDDHDYGVNDAGKELSDHAGRVSVFLDFLGVGPEDPRRGGSTLYSSHTFGEAPRKVKVIMLDIRTQRDGYHAFNIAHRKFKFAAMIGAMFRWFSSSFCLGSDYAGSVIGDDQWEWLEGQLEDSDASVHVLVSTLQVLTSNPLVESWGHFPHSRKRLLDLLHRMDPAGLVILSGDVHHAELASGWRATPSTSAEGHSGTESAKSGGVSLPPGHPPVESESDAGRGSGGKCPFAKRGAAAVETPEAPTASEAASQPTIATCDAEGEGCGSSPGSGPPSSSSLSSGPDSDPDCLAHSGVGGSVGGEGRGVVEVTTSGMTHSCLSVHGKPMCEAYLSRWTQHRWRDDAYYLDSNFGDIEIEWAEEENIHQPVKMAVTVRDREGIPILPVIEHYGGYTDGEDQKDSARRSRRAAGFPPATLADEGKDDGGEQRQEQRRREEQEQPKARQEIERTFLDRSPPSECVEAVLPGGCTARRVSAAVVCILALVFTCVGFSRGARYLISGSNLQRTKNKQGAPKSEPTLIAGGNGARNGTRNGS